MQFVYAIINFILLAAILYIFARKIIIKIFVSRKERINQELDEAEKLAEITEEEDGDETVLILDNSSAIADEEAVRDEEIRILRSEFEKNARNMRLEMLLDNRTSLVSQTIEKARQMMSTDAFQKKLRCQEDAVADEILSLIKLTPGDVMYMKSKGVLYVTLTSSYPLKSETIERIKRETDALLATKGGVSSFRIIDDKADLLGGFRLRIGDTIYDYTVKNRLYRLKEALNDLPLTDKDEASMLESMQNAVKKIKIGVDVFQVGRVLSVSDGICWMDGLSDIMYGELVEFTGAQRQMYGMVMDVQPDKVGCIIFGRFEHIESLSAVRRLGRMATAPVGDELLGRVIDPIGEPIDGKGRLWSTKTRLIEFPAPAIPDREPVNVPLETGIKAIDAMVPIGRGQRELLIGDRQTGKSSIIVDTILNQRGKGVKCVYVAIGQKETTVATIVSRLEKYGAMDYTTVVLASASDSASLQYIAPFVGTAIAEYFMYNGQDSLVIYDDLSKHAVAYREISLLLHRPSGREAYPGDIFYLHSRLLERAARLNKEAGGGSMTALPVIETQAGDISAYIPTNVISITDGQIFLETDLFNAGQRPAVNVGLSVSRVGGSAQSKLMKQVAANLRTSLAQYREYASFTQFGSEVDDATRKTLDQGERMMAVLRQDRFDPLPTWIQASIIFAVSNGAADDYESEKMNVFEKEFISFLKSSKPELCEILQTGNKMSKETINSFKCAISEFKQII